MVGRTGIIWYSLDGGGADWHSASMAEHVAAPNYIFCLDARSGHGVVDFSV